MGWFILLYFVIGFITLIAWAYDTFKDIASNYTPDVYWEALESVNNMTDEASNMPRAFRAMLGFVIWPRIFVIGPIYKEELMSECDFISKLK